MTDIGLFGPNSVTWRLHADPLMGIGGLRALLLQALHPVAMAGVSEHSTFRVDPWGRLLRTAEYVATVTYAPAADARRAGARVRGIHRGVTGVEPSSGAAYRAADPDLLLWVHCCLVDSFLNVVRRGSFRLSAHDRDTYVNEQVRLAKLVGVNTQIVPASTAELADYFTAVRPKLRSTPAAREAARLVLLPPMRRSVALGTPARPAWASVAALAAASLPRWARRMFSLPGLPTTDLATTAGLRALRTSLLVLPPVVRDGPHLRAARERVALAAADG